MPFPGTNSAQSPPTYPGLTTFPGAYVDPRDLTLIYVVARDRWTATVDEPAETTAPRP